MSTEFYKLLHLRKLQ